MLILALIFALILDSGKVWLAKLFRVGIFVPYAVPVVIAALMWGYLYGKDFGPFADIADKLGEVAAELPRASRLMLFSLANVATWTYTGYNMIILYAALRSIPTELYEAAAVDGAGPVSTALAHQAAAAAPGAAAVHDLLGHRLVPAVRGAAHLLRARPDVIGKDYTPNLYVYNLAFADQRLNYAAALSFLLGAVVFVISYVVMYSSRRQEARR